MSARRPAAERVLALIAGGLAAIFLAIDGAGYFASNQRQLAKLGDSLREVSERADDGPVDRDLAQPKPLARGIDLVTAPTKWEFGHRSMFTDLEIAAWSAEAERRDKLRGDLSPPLRLRAERRGNDVEVKFDFNPANATLRDLGESSLLRAGYQLYRWRDREEPTLVANLGLNETSYRDRGIGPRAGTLQYSIKTVLKDRIGDVETLIQSSAVESIRLELDELFTLELLAATADRATLQVTVPIDDEQRSTHFEVEKNAPVGSILRLDGAETDFRTGLTLESIAIVETVSERQRRVPVFNADGSRATGESGFLFRDEIRKVPIRRTTVRLVAAGGGVRELVRDDDLPVAK
jgi:hypothetical protein